MSTQTSSTRTALETHFDGLAIPEREALAASLGISTAYLRQVAKGYYRASPQLARSIESKTDGQVRKESLRPDVFGE